MTKKLVAAKQQDERPFSGPLPITVSKHQLVEILGIGIRSVDNFIAQGLIKRSQHAAHYMLVESSQSYCGKLREQAAGRATSTGSSLSDERAQTERVNREIAELKLKRLKGDIVEVGELQDSYGRFAALVRQSVLTLPGKARATIPHLTAHDAETLKQICRDILDEISQSTRGGAFLGIEPAGLADE